MDSPDRPHRNDTHRQLAAQSIYQTKLGYPDPGRYRRTPPGAPTVSELVRPGDTVRTSYGTGGIVTAVDQAMFTAPTGEAFPHFTIVVVPPGQCGRYPDQVRHCLNEYVAVDGRIRKLFEASNDEVFVVERARPISEPKTRSILISG